MKSVKRQKYINQVKPYIGKHIIKVLTGLRRVRKTTILKQIIEEIKNNAPATNIIYINKEYNEFKNSDFSR